MSPDFLALMRREPLLGILLSDAARSDDGSPDFCAVRAWGGRDGFKARLGELVGWGRDGEPDVELSGSTAYEVAYEAILSAIPRCRGECGCGESRVAV